MVCPSVIAVLPQPPASRNGKIDRNSLGQMDLNAFAPDLNADVGTPTGDVKLELVNIFSKVLKVENSSCGVSHDLFAVGLNSLVTVQAAGNVSKAFNVHIGLNNIYLRPTTHFLIKFLPIKKKGTQPRVYIVTVHDIMGMATPFVRLSAFLPNGMYAISDQLFGSETVFRSIDAMAEHYISMIKTVQSESPYLIVGYSYRGSVADTHGTCLESVESESLQWLFLLVMNSSLSLDDSPSNLLIPSFLLIPSQIVFFGSR
ncbi:hypothetical protein HYDPIDRAFT_34600 [Hydnomerulius pinastri MD-312]|uniref:Carrier domain-containing protein n=1 Tax=Hydnomerulius pinastri MD-312 TaxID=994086 RepID=A0A0C9W5R7_9AGAM|nr:hypothetical protein HYDPIDRAFT_34600 [Hydnomerulius pinastri MD-312]